VFHSFHYKPDNWRAAQVRNMGVIEGNVPVSDNDWETITRGGDAAIERWIADQMDGKSCCVVGVYIHNLKDRDGNQSPKGRNAFEDLTVDGKRLSSILKAYNPTYSTSTLLHDHIKDNLAQWVEEAISIRNSLSGTACRG